VTHDSVIALSHGAILLTPPQQPTAKLSANKLGVIPLVICSRTGATMLPSTLLQIHCMRIFLSKHLVPDKLIVNADDVRRGFPTACLVWTSTNRPR